MILLGKLDSLKISMRTLKLLILPVIIPSFLTTTLREFWTSTSNYSSFIGLVLITITLCLVCKAKGIMEIGKFFICTLLSLIIIAIGQTMYVPLLLYGSSVPLDYLWKPSLSLLFWTLPERALEIGIIAYIAAKRTSLLKINFFKTIIESKLLTVLTSVVFSFNLVFLVIMIVLIGQQKILYTLPFTNQILAIVAILLLPIINLITLFSAIYHVKSREIHKRFNIQEELRVSISDIEFFLKRGEYDRIRKELEYLERDTNELYNEKA